jgi:23S rRNA (guanosine2251-2'-O)-methyltransferase
MSAEIFDFRLCVNPDCGLRYPAPRGNTAGKRCPVCLGHTVVVEQSAGPYEGTQTSTKSHSNKELRAVLDNVRSALNVGSIFRSAEGYGFRHLYLCGITPTPAAPELRKTALGAEGLVKWSTHANAVQLISSLKGDGYCIWALEHTQASRALESVLATATQGEKRVLVVGNERAGVDPGILRLADQVVHLAMRGHKGSFNVAVAFAIAADELDRQDN